MVKWSYLIESDAAVTKAVRELRKAPFDLTAWEKALLVVDRRGLKLALWVNLGNIWGVRVVNAVQAAQYSREYDFDVTYTTSNMPTFSQPWHNSSWTPFKNLVNKQPFRIGLVKHSAGGFTVIDDGGLSTWRNTRGKLVGMNPRTLIWAARHKKKSSEE